MEIREGRTEARELTIKAKTIIKKSGICAKDKNYTKMINLIKIDLAAKNDPKKALRNKNSS